MLELKYDILDDLEARQINAAQQVADEEEHLLTPKDWYEECRRTGANAIFAIGFPYRLFHQKGGYNFDINEFIEAHNDIKERYFKGLPDVQIVHPEINYCDVKLPNWIQSETYEDAKDFLYSELRWQMNTDSCVLFKIPVKIDIVETVQMPSKMNSLCDTIIVSTDYKSLNKRINRTVSKVCNFLANIQSFHKKYHLYRDIFFITELGDEGGYVELHNTQQYLFDVKYRQKRSNDLDLEHPVIQNLTSVCSCHHRWNCLTDFEHVKKYFNEWANKQLKYVNK